MGPPFGRPMGPRPHPMGPRFGRPPMMRPPFAGPPMMGPHYGGPPMMGPRFGGPAPMVPYIDAQPFVGDNHYDSDSDSDSDTMETKTKKKQKKKSDPVVTTPTLAFIQQQVLLQVAKEEAIEEDTTNKTRCEICKISVESETVYKVHILSSEHKARLEFRNKLNKSKIVQAKAALIAKVNSQINDTTDVDNDKTYVEQDAVGDANGSEKGSTRNDKKIAINIHYKGRPKEKKTCRVCQIELPSVEEYMKHVQSLMHENKRESRRKEDQKEREQRRHTSRDNHRGRSGKREGSSEERGRNHSRERNRSSRKDDQPERLNRPGRFSGDTHRSDSRSYPRDEERRNDSRSHSREEERRNDSRKLSRERDSRDESRSADSRGDQREDRYRGRRDSPGAARSSEYTDLSEVTVLTHQPVVMTSAFRGDTWDSRVPGSLAPKKRVSRFSPGDAPSQKNVPPQTNIRPPLLPLPPGPRPVAPNNLLIQAPELTDNKEYCTVCNVTLPNNDAFIKHIGGILHKERVSRSRGDKPQGRPKSTTTQIDYARNFAGFYENVANMGSQHGPSNGQKVQASRYCALCDVPFQSEETFKRHQRSLMHIQKMKASGLREQNQDMDRKRKLDEDGKLSCQICGIECFSILTYQSHMDRNHSQKVLLPTPPEGAGPSSSMRSSLHEFFQQTQEPIIGLMYITEFQDTNPQIEPSFECRLCIKSFDYTGVKGHLVSHDHRITCFKKHHPDVMTSILRLRRNSKAYAANFMFYAHDVEAKSGRGEIVIVVKNSKPPTVAKKSRFDDPNPIGQNYPTHEQSQVAPGLSHSMVHQTPSFASQTPLLGVHQPPPLASQTPLLGIHQPPPLASQTPLLGVHQPPPLASQTTLLGIHQPPPMTSQTSLFGVHQAPPLISQTPALAPQTASLASRVLALVSQAPPPQPAPVAPTRVEVDPLEQLLPQLLLKSSLLAPKPTTMLSSTDTNASHIADNTRAIQQENELLATILAALAAKKDAAAAQVAVVTPQATVLPHQILPTTASTSHWGTAVRNTEKEEYDPFKPTSPGHDSSYRSHQQTLYGGQHHSHYGTQDISRQYDNRVSQSGTMMSSNMQSAGSLTETLLQNLKASGSMQTNAPDLNSLAEQIRRLQNQ